MKAKSWVSGGKWLRLPEFLRNLAQNTNLGITTHIEKRLFTETVFFEIVGEKENIVLFNDLIKRVQEQ